MLPLLMGMAIACYSNPKKINKQNWTERSGKWLFHHFHPYFPPFWRVQQITMGIHHFWMIFPAVHLHFLLDFPACHVNDDTNPPFSYDFPMVFLWFSHCPMVFPWLSHFPMVFLWVFPLNMGFPMVFLWFSPEGRLNVAWEFQSSAGYLGAACGAEGRSLPNLQHHGLTGTAGQDPWRGRKAGREVTSEKDFDKSIVQIF